MEAMRLFRHTVTGSVGEYPDHYASLFPNLEPVDEAEACIDCIPTVDELDEPNFLGDGEDNPFELNDKEGVEYERR